MVKRLFALFRRKRKTQVQMPPLGDCLEAYSRSRTRVRAIKEMRAKIIQANGETTPHVERALERALKTRKRSFDNLRRARSQLKSRSHD